MHVKVAVVAVPVTIIVSLGIACILRAAMMFPFPAPQKCAAREGHTPIFVDETRIKRFVDAIGFKTISWSRGVCEKQELLNFGHFLKTSFPTLHSSSFVEFQTINNFSLLYTIKGSNPSLKPYLLIAHLDVVPVEEEKWHFPPFDGFIENGHIYGRGTMDIKNIVMAVLEALQHMLQNGFKPQRTFYMVFGHDEEVFGFDGAQSIAQHLRIIGVKDFEFILDEGTAILRNMFPGVKTPVATISVAEKGYASFKITAKGEAGHSSMPPSNSAILKLTAAIAKFHPNLHKNMFGKGIEKDMLEAVAPYASFPYKVVYSNLWLFSPIVAYFFGLNPTTNSVVRTTTAVTMIKSGVKENVLPSEAEAMVNHRIHPLQSVNEILEIDRSVINNQQISVELCDTPVEPSPISPYKTDVGFHIISTTVKQIFGDIAIVPSIMIGSTDSKWFLNFSRSVYRFAPYLIDKEDVKLFHGHNERISIENYEKMINFYEHLFLNSDASEFNKKARNSKDEL